jgi:hypothetical protein
MLLGQVTYGVTAAAFGLSLNTRSIWEPLQIIGATAGGLIGFVFPCMLALHRPSPALVPAGAQGREHASGWTCIKTSDLGATSLIALGVLQCIAGIAAQVFTHTAPDQERVVRP